MTSRISARVRRGGVRMLCGLALAVAVQQAFPAAINSGGGAVGSFVADTGYSGGTAVSNTSATINTSGITNPAPQAVYQSERYGNFSYTVPGLVAGAAYRVRLHFVESYWQQAGQRVFNVSINGTPYLSSFDIYAAAGATNKAVIKEFNVAASAAGNISLQFSSLVNNAKVDGIEVLPITPVAIDAGGGASGGYVADTGFSGGTAVTNTTSAIDTSGVTNPAPQAAYRSERYGNFSYSIPNLTPGASYRVRLHFVESYWTQAGQRSFNVSVNGSSFLGNFDIYAAAGAARKAVVRELVVPATAAGSIALQFTSVVNNAKVDAIEVLPVVAGSAPVALPAAPAGLSATAGNAAASLTWSAVSGASGYNVKRALTSGGPYGVVAGNLSGTSYTNTGLTNGSTYYYVVSASNSAGEGANSAQVSVRPVAPVVVPSAPTNLSAVAGNAAATLSWSAVTGATGYSVKRAPTSGGPYSVVASSLTATSYTNSGLSNGTTYYYVVSASNAAGESPNSVPASVTLAVPNTLPNPKLGVNLEGLYDWNRSMMFVDVVKTSRGFGHPSAPWCMSGGQGGCPTSGYPTRDANGWPQGDSAVILLTSNDGLNRSLPQTFPSLFGTYALQFTGRATVTALASPGVTVQNVSYNATTNTTTASVVMSTTANQLFLSFTGTSGGVRNVQLLRPGYPLGTTQLFTNEFLNAIRPYSTLRAMDYLHVNDSNVRQWSDRTLPTYATQAMPNGGSWEYLIQLANVTGKDIWINIPDQVDLNDTSSNNYVIQLANLLKAQLKPGIRVYVEWSNEVWNSMFAQYLRNYNAASAEVKAGDPNKLSLAGTDSNTYYWAHRRNAHRIYLIANLFKQVYGTAAVPDTIRPVLASQFAQPFIFEDSLRYLKMYYGEPRNYLYGIAGAPYINATQARTTLDPLFSDLWGSLNGLLPMFSGKSFYTGGYPVWNVTQKSLADYYGIKSIAYEGSLDPKNYATVSLSLAEQSVYDPRTGQIIQAWLNQWYGCGNDLFMYFGLSGAPTNWGVWGIYEDMTLPTVKSRTLEAVANTPIANFTTCQ